MTDVVMPQMGESIVEGTLTKWLKKPGDPVERDEPLFEISTDKVDTEIPSPAAGVLAETLVEEGKTVGINTVVARINESGGAATAAEKPAPTAEAKPEAPAAPPPPPAPAATAPPPPPPEVAPAPEPAEVSGPLSPLVRKMAREYNLDLSKIKGTGAGGRITKQDVESYIAQQRQAAAAAPVEAPPPQPLSAPAPPPPAPAAQPMAPLPAPGQAKTRIEPMSTMRIKIAEHMVASKRTSAHVTTIHKVDMTKVARMRERHKADFQARYGLPLTYLPFVTRATVVALRTFPLLNASIEGNNIIHHNEIHIGIAVALENGLIVPVIRNADEKNVVGLQRAIVDLSTRARSRQLKPDEVVGGTFSITNFGGFGSVMATPVINQPQVAILGVGAVEKTPVVIDDAIAIRAICYLSLSFDHRLIDGALGDQFTAKIKEVLENWSEEVL
jgi:pyruvate dehydrogenase E2 component (dihydrolipoyllysine-residue acetyltransferase)